MSETEFDIHEHRRVRNRELEQRVIFLEGERDRLELLLATLLRLASRTIEREPELILDACCTILDLNPAKAHIHDQPPVPVPAETKADDLAA